MYDGILNINKPQGLTSHDIVYKIKKITGEKVGHTGTLDPLATGVLPICIGQATKISQYIMAKEKTYRVEATFGISTDTFDITGKILSQNDFEFNNQLETEILSTLKNFVGGYYQMPPIFSAIKKNGKKLYELARSGIDFEPEKRFVNIEEISEIKFLPPDKLIFEVKCSKGTYIRSLCNDLGKKIGCGACMSKLERTQCGNFFIKDSITLEDFNRLIENKLTEKKITKIQDALNYKHVTVSSAADKFLYNGNKINLSFAKCENEISEEENLFVFDELKNLVGIYKKNDGFLCPVRILR